jgi:hypothetical protein
MERSLAERSGGGGAARFHHFHFGLSKSWLHRIRIFHTHVCLISQVRKTMLEEGFIHEVREDELDDHGKPKKGKTPFVVLAKDVK